MPIRAPEGYLDITNATLRASEIVTTSNVGIANANPTNTLSIGSNVFFEDTASNTMTVRGNVVTEGIKLGFLQLLPSYDLELTANVGNSISNTVQFTNSTTGFITSSNVGIGTNAPDGLVDVGTVFKVKFADLGATAADITDGYNTVSITESGGTYTYTRDTAANYGNFLPTTASYSPITGRRYRVKLTARSDYTGSIRLENPANGTVIASYDLTTTFTEYEWEFTSIATTMYFRATITTGTTLQFNAFSMEVLESTANTDVIMGGTRFIKAHDPSKNFVAIGPSAGQTSQASYATAVGNFAGATSQGDHAVAVGDQAGRYNQGDYAIALGKRAAETDQSTAAVAIGGDAGRYNQGSGAVAIGEQAALTSQGASAIAIGDQTARYNQGANATAVGRDAGLTSQGINTVAVGIDAGEISQGNYATAVGDRAGQTAQGSYAVAVGNDAGNTSQAVAAVAVGYDAGDTSQGSYAVAVGYNAGESSQGNSAVAVGNDAGQTSQGSYTTALGAFAGQSTQGANATALGRQAGRYNQGITATAVGYAAGEITQASAAVAVGLSAGQYNQGLKSAAVGNEAGRSNQGDYATAVGYQAGEISQDILATAVGCVAGQTSQGGYATAVGYQAGRYNQGGFATALGYAAGESNQGSYAVAVGVNAGKIGQGIQATAIGNRAGESNQGNYAVAIGDYAGFNNQHNNSIVLNATNSILNTGQASSFYVKPVRGGNFAASALAYTSAGEVVEETGTNFNSLGYVGIGTADPNQGNLTVYGLGADPYFTGLNELNYADATDFTGLAHFKSSGSHGVIRISNSGDYTGTTRIDFNTRLGSYWGINTPSNSYFRGTAPAAGRIMVTGEINNNYEDAYMSFHTCRDTRVDGQGGTGNLYERMRISSAGNVGIGTVSPKSKLDVYQGANVTFGGLVATIADSPGLTLSSSGGKWGIFLNSNSDLIFTGKVGATGYYTGVSGFVVSGARDVRMNFTGQHRTFIKDIPFTRAEELEGLIVSADNNTYIKMSGGIEAGSNAITTNESLPVVSLSTKVNDKKCFGVISSSENPETREDAYGSFVTPYDKELGDTRVYINSVGEGAMWVTDTNGPLESGDYITTSNVAGYGQRQDDDVLHNYTVAKITMDCDFDPATQPLQIIKKELANVNYWVKTTVSNVSLEEYSNLAVDMRTSTTETYYSNEDGEIGVTEYSNLESNVQSTYTELTRTVYQKISKEELKTETEGYDIEVREELVNVLDEHDQLQWEDHPTETEKAYKIRYLDATGVQTDEANAVHIAAFVGVTYHCG